MNKLTRPLLGAFFFACLPAAVNAQRVLAVTECGSPSPFFAPTPGKLADLFVDVNGNLCVGGSGGGGGGSTISGPLGPSTAAASAVAMTFATGSTLPPFATPPTVVVSGPLGPSTATANAVAVTPASGSLFVVNAGVNSASALWGSVNNATSASGGVAKFSRIPSSAATTNLTGIASTPARLYIVGGCNTTASTIYLKTYNIASGAVTVGTSTVFDTFAFPANSCQPPGLVYGDIGSFYSVALTYALTTGAADSDATAPAAGAIVGLKVGWQ